MGVPPPIMGVDVFNPLDEQHQRRRSSWDFRLQSYAAVWRTDIKILKRIALLRRRHAFGFPSKYFSNHPCTSPHHNF
jgi:hypothetical protein